MEEERAIYFGMAVVGAPAVIASLLHGRPIGAGDTIAGLLVVIGIAGLVRRRAKLPKARARWR
jgi:hypothetical protein